MEKQTLFWLFTAIFAITAVITLLGITGVLKNIKEKYLNTLFTALILEVIAAIFFVFKGFDFNEKTGVNLSAMISEAGFTPPNDEARQDDFIVNKLAECIALNNQLEQLETENKSLKMDLENKLAELNKCAEKGSSFYSKITRLDEIIGEYKQQGLGNSININFNQAEKKEVFELLVSIFSYLDMIKEGDGSSNPDKSINTKYMQKLFAKFKSTYSDNPDHLIYIGVSDLSQMVQAKLKLDE